MPLFILRPTEEANEMSKQSNVQAVNDSVYRREVVQKPTQNQWADWIAYCFNTLLFLNLLTDIVLVFVRHVNCINCHLLPVHASVYLAPCGGSGWNEKTEQCTGSNQQCVYRREVVQKPTQNQWADWIAYCLIRCCFKICSTIYCWFLYDMSTV